MIKLFYLLVAVTLGCTHRQTLRSGNVSAAAGERPAAATLPAFRDHLDAAAILKGMKPYRQPQAEFFLPDAEGVWWGFSENRIRRVYSPR